MSRATIFLFFSLASGYTGHHRPVQNACPTVKIGVQLFAGGLANTSLRISFCAIAMQSASFQMPKGQERQERQAPSEAVCLQCDTLLIHYLLRKRVHPIRVQ